jgi:hypothetical protein
MINKPTYKEFVIPYLKDFDVVMLSKQEVEDVKKFAIDLEEAKKSEPGYITDGEGIYYRHLNGLYAEKAVEKKFGVRFIDYSVGQSSKYDDGDLKNAGCSHVGVKGVMLNYQEEPFHLVMRAAIKCEILVFLEKLSNGDIKCYIAGIYTPDVLREYNTRVGVKDNINVNKAYFYGIQKYKKIPNYNYIKQYNDQIPGWLKKNNIQIKAYA